MKKLLITFSSINLIVLFFILITLFSPTHAQSSTDVCRADSIDHYKTQFGFYDKSSSGYQYPNPLNASHKANFESIRENMRKYSPYFDLDPVISTWWVFFETGGKLDSYSWSNCGDRNRDVNYNCPSAGSGQWQLGYGQQFGDSLPRFIEAFQTIYGDPNNVSKTKEVGQNVLNRAGQNRTFPDKSAQQLFNENRVGNDAQYWISVLQRDPAISAYLLSYRLSGDLSGARSRGILFRDLTFGWSSYYRTNWQSTSNLLNDILLAWNDTNNQSSESCSSLDSRTPGTPSDRSGSNTNTGGIEEHAVNNISMLTTPEEVNQGYVQFQKEENLLDLIKKKFSEFASLFFSAPKNEGQFYGQSENIHKSNFPQEVAPQSEDPIEKVKGFLGTNQGFYGVELPVEINSDKVHPYEETYGQTHFGINPFTGKENF